MAWLGLFRKKKKRKKTTRKSVSNRTQGIKGKVEKLEAEIKTIHLLLQNHDQSIIQHTQTLETHTQKLEELVDQAESNQPEIIVNNTNPGYKSPQIPETNIAPVEKSDKLNIDSLSGRERKILHVFFQHPDMALSYADIGSFLHKSPNTIKNQLRQLRLKADLFSQSTDADNRNRFRLKDQLRVENYLNLADSSATKS